MAKIGYSFDSGRPALNSRYKRGGSGGRFFIIFIILLLFGGGIYFMFLRSDNNPEKKELLNQPSMPQSEEQIKTSAISIGDKTIATVKPHITKLVNSDNFSSIKTSAIVNTLCTASASAMDDKEYTLARSLALKALQQPENIEYSKGWMKTAEVLSQANSAIINSDIPLPGKKIRYKVVSGDALQKIAKKFNTTVELIQRSNNMKTNNYVVWEGQGLKIYRGDWKIKISKKHRLLALYDGNELFKIYHIGIGKQDRTPECNFTIVSKKKNPDWYKSKKEIIPFGTKENVLGTRWLALKATDEKLQHFTGYGIHGTWNDASIGKAMSNGCIRMKNPEVEELFAIVPYKTEVVIEK